MSRSVGRGGVIPFIVGGVTALAGVRLFAPRHVARAGPDPFGMQSGRGAAEAPPDAASVVAGFEGQDAQAGGVGWIMLLFAAFAIAGVALMVLLLSVLHHRDAAREAGLTVEQRAQPELPAPRLQIHPIGELAGLRAVEFARLHNYGWVDSVTAHIPIERAMALVAGQSLDAHAAPETVMPETVVPGTVVSAPEAGR